MKPVEVELAEFFTSNRTFAIALYLALREVVRGVFS